MAGNLDRSPGDLDVSDGGAHLRLTHIDPTPVSMQCGQSPMNSYRAGSSPPHVVDSHLFRPANVFRLSDHHVGLVIVFAARHTSAVSEMNFHLTRSS